eukprot:1941525-Amphidinium_carterae.1
MRGENSRTCSAHRFKVDRYSHFKQTNKQTNHLTNKQTNNKQQASRTSTSNDKSNHNKEV